MLPVSRKFVAEYSGIDLDVDVAGHASIIEAGSGGVSFLPECA